MPQNQKTEPATPTDTEELPELTEKQHNFVQALLEGKTYSDAYREAYDASEMKPRLIWREASLLAAHPKVTQWLEALRTSAVQTGVASIEEHTAQLRRLRELALKTGNLGAAVNAEVNLGKASGLHIDRIQDVDRGRELAILDRIFKRHGRTAVLAAAERLGLEPQEYSHILGQDQVTH